MDVCTDPVIKKVMSISLGSSARDAVRQIVLGKYKIILERREQMVILSKLHPIP